LSATNASSRACGCKVTEKYGITLIPPFRGQFRDPFGNQLQVVDLHDESLV
jgi:hypothetical protein